MDDGTAVQLPSRDFTVYGREVALYDDWMGFIVGGHDRRAWAAANMIAREEFDLRPANKRVSAKWVLLFDTCGCTEGEHGSHLGDCYEHCVEDRHGLPPCSDQYGWMSRYVKEGTPDAVPVIHLVNT